MNKFLATLAVVFCVLAANSITDVDIELPLRSEKTATENIDFMSRASREKRQTTAAPQIPTLISFNPLTLLNNPFLWELIKNFATNTIRNITRDLQNRRAARGNPGTPRNPTYYSYGATQQNRYYYPYYGYQYGYQRYG
ncbi:hypothetical protein KIN20_029356 [Parelaphostrongylus tenuis]|uniref:Uncharacterized protein n=1 Tax=Parelaphostrongylus tenuis TaxID=148309 RepID=A0AAD5R335_PARTN|nr:hypothetical protein KIN20_029356 [Parelaphostrongylus tenuis]